MQFALVVRCFQRKVGHNVVLFLCDLSDCASHAAKRTKILAQVAEIAEENKAAGIPLKTAKNHFNLAPGDCAAPPTKSTDRLRRKSRLPT